MALETKNPNVTLLPGDIIRIEDLCALRTFDSEKDIVKFLCPEAGKLPENIWLSITGKRYAWGDSRAFVTIKGSRSRGRNRGQGKRFFVKPATPKNSGTLDLAPIRAHITELVPIEAKLEAEDKALMAEEHRLYEQRQKFEAELETLYPDTDTSADYSISTHHWGSTPEEPRYDLTVRNLSEEQVKQLLAAVKS